MVLGRVEMGCGGGRGHTTNASITFSMHVDDVSGNGFIGDGIALVENHEKQIKPGRNIG